MGASFDQTLAGITLAPYIGKATALIGVRRRSGSNMIRHQLSTMAILLDYKMLDSPLLKASVIHDLFENAPTMPGVTEGEITQIDADGPAVFALVMELTPRAIGGVKEPKLEYLQRLEFASAGRSGVRRFAGDQALFQRRRRQAHQRRSIAYGSRGVGPHGVEQQRVGPVRKALAGQIGGADDQGERRRHRDPGRRTRAEGAVGLGVAQPPGERRLRQSNASGGPGAVPAGLFVGHEHDLVREPAADRQG
jgi:hypothetical protein